jgi:hypothetical protein
MQSIRKRWLLVVVAGLAVSLSSCEQLLPGPEAEIDISPPSWILGTWENGDTGETITFTSSDVLFDGSSLRSWAKQNDISIADFDSDDVDFDSRFSHAYWVNSGQPGSDLSSGQRQFDAFRFIDPPDYVRVVVRPAFSGFSSIDFRQTSTGSGGGGSGDDSSGGGSTTTGISIWTSNSGQGFIAVYVNGTFRGTLTNYFSSGTPDYAASGTVTVELSAGSHTIYAEAESGATWGPSSVTLQSGDQATYELQ